MGLGTDGIRWFDLLAGLTLQLMTKPLNCLKVFYHLIHYSLISGVMCTLNMWWAVFKNTLYRANDVKRDKQGNAKEHTRLHVYGLYHQRLTGCKCLSFCLENVWATASFQAAESSDLKLFLTQGKGVALQVAEGYCLQRMVGLLVAQHSDTNSVISL